MTDDTIESLQIVLKAEDDECAENDVYTAYAIIEDTPKILLKKCKLKDKMKVYKLKS